MLMQKSLEAGACLKISRFFLLLSRRKFAAWFPARHAPSAGPAFFARRAQFPPSELSNRAGSKKLGKFKIVKSTFLSKKIYLKSAVKANILAIEIR